MRIPLRILIPGALVVFFSIAAAVLIGFSVYFSYHNSVEKVVDARKMNLEVLNSTLYDPLVYYRIRAMIPDLPQRVVQETAKAPDVLFVRIVDPNTNEVLVSSVEAEQGTFVYDPPLFRGAISHREGIWRGQGVIELYSRATQSEGLWLAISKDRVREIALQQALVSTGVVVVVIIILLMVLQSFLRRLIVDPISHLQQSLKRIEKGNLDVHLPEHDNNEMGDVNRSFNKMANALQEAREHEQLISDMKTEFISIAAHQLRTPLSAIKWMLSMIMSGDLGKVTKDQKEHLQLGAESIDRMTKLIQDLLDVSRIEQGKLGFEFTEDSLIDLMENVIKELEPAAEKKKIQIDFEKPAEDAPRVRMDPEKLRMVLSNLLDNAIKYTPEKGSISVGIDVDKKKHTLIAHVKDTGMGIPKGELDRMFTKFFRAGNANRLQTEGSGLGLFLAKSIVERHNGSIWVESEENKGSVFYFTLPYLA